MAMAPTNRPPRLAAAKLTLQMRHATFDIPNDAPQIGLELPCAPLGKVHLLRMCRSTLLAEQVLGFAVVVLPKVEATFLGSMD